MTLYLDDAVTRMKELTGVTKENCRGAIELVLILFEDVLERGDNLVLRGSLELTHKIKNEMTTRDLHTGERITYPAKTLPHITWGIRMKRAAEKNADWIKKNSVKEGGRNGVEGK